MSQKVILAGSGVTALLIAALLISIAVIAALLTTIAENGSGVESPMVKAAHQKLQNVSMAQNRDQQRGAPRLGSTITPEAAHYQQTAQGKPHEFNIEQHSTSLEDVREAFRTQSKPDMSMALEHAEGVAQATWCSVPRKEQRRYSLKWHAVLPHVAKALMDSLGTETAAAEIHAKGDIYAFGVAQGDSMSLLHATFPERRIFGADSFKGLPMEDSEESKLKIWAAGKFKAKVSKESLIDSAGGRGIAHVIPGFFNESLTPELVKKESMGPAFYVDIDADLHKSTYDALDWLFANKLVRVGTMIGYDDWWTIPCQKFHRGGEKDTRPLLVGEGLAHAEIARKYRVQFRCMAGPCKPFPNMSSSFGECHLNNNWGPVFVVADLGTTQEGSHGFTFTQEQEQVWKEKNKVCPR